MQFEFEITSEFDILSALSEKFGTETCGDKLIIPSSFGMGTVQRISLSDSIKLTICDYKIKREMIINYSGTKGSKDIININLNGKEDVAASFTNEQQNLPCRRARFATQIASSDLDYKTVIPANTEIYSLSINIRLETLQELLSVTKPNNVIRTIFDGSLGFLFSERMNDNDQKILKQIILADAESELNIFYLKIKVQELLYLFFEKLLKWKDVKFYPIHKEDIEKLFRVRTVILFDLSVPPRLLELSKMIGFSETKLKELFKQQFGDSIYNYYQKSRMEEAAALLKSGKHTVSEVGYMLGFTNLSHFGRLFEKHYGIKPKKYTFGG